MFNTCIFNGSNYHYYSCSITILVALFSALHPVTSLFFFMGHDAFLLHLQVTGVVMDKDGKAHYVLSGTWDEKMEFSRVMQSSRGGENGTEGKQKTVYQTLKAREVWRRNPLL